MTAYWKAFLAVIVGLAVLVVVAVFYPHADTALTVAAVQTVVTALAVLVGPKNKETP